jgi:hypothetical protein
MGERWDEFNEWIRETSDGVFFSLHAFYYDDGRMMRQYKDFVGQMYRCLEDHRLIYFPIELDEVVNA